MEGNQSHLPAYFSTGERKGEVSNAELTENVEALVPLQPTHREDSSAADLDKVQRDDGSTKAHAPGQYN